MMRMTKKKRIPKTSLLVVIDDSNTLVNYFNTMDEVFTYVENNSAQLEDLKILECTKAYTLYYPEDPDPEVLDLPLDEVI
jgi:hypothetical protein